MQSGISWGDIGAIVGGLAAVFGLFQGFAFYLHRERSKKFETLEKKIDEHAKSAAKEHAIVRAQVADMAGTFAASYVRKEELENRLDKLDQAAAEIRRDVGSVHSRIDNLFERVEFRQRRE